MASHPCPRCGSEMVKITSPINLGWVCLKKHILTTAAGAALGR